MRTTRSTALLGLLGLAASAIMTVLPGPASAAVTDLSTVPLQTATPVAKPNLLFILDDSGSMAWDFMPDWAETSTDALARNSAFNATYYNPAIYYEPPPKPDGSRYPSMTAGTTSNWTRVPFDGFGVQTARNTGNVLFTNQNSGTTQNLVGNAYYYVFIPGEHCTDPNLKTCVRADAPTTSHPYPALLRWCNTSTDCRATRIESGTRTYTSARYPGMSLGLFQGTVPGQNQRVNIVSNNNSYAYPGTARKAATRSDCLGATCTYAEEMTNFANWWAYYRTRMQMAKSAAASAFTNVNEKFRIGYMSINNNTGSDFLNVRDVETLATTTSHRFQWYSKLLAAEPGSSTPLRTALSTAGRYFANKLTKVNGVNTTDPMQYACQRNYTMLSTDGYWNERNAPTDVEGLAIGDTDSGKDIERPYYDGTRTGSTLADVAQYFYATDLRSSTFGNTVGALNQDVASNNVDDKQQRMYTSTIGLGASGYMQYRADYDVAGTGDYHSVLQGATASNGVCGWQTSGACNWPKVVSNEQTTIDDLWHAAVNGRGRYYSAANPIELRDGLQAFIQEAGRGGATQVTSPAVSNLNLSKDDNLAFGTTYAANAWFGEVFAYTLDPVTGNASTSNLWSQSEPLYAGGPSTAPARTVPKLETMDPAARKIYTAEFTGTEPKLIEFKWGSMSNDTKSHFRVGAIGTLSQFCASGAGCLQAGARIDSDNPGRGTGVGGINLVNFLRGDRSNEGTDNISYYRKRTHVLGDVVNAQPIYVRKPLFNYQDAGYTEFKRQQENRTAMLYVGANDGMLHAFEARTGAEAWAYIPSMLLPQLHKLADKDYANRHQFYVNGTPRQGDIYHGDRWRTILVGGLGRGGRGYYALDITDAKSPPKVLWEFSHDSSKGARHISDPDLGYSYGTPVITKLSDGTWVVIVSSGYNNLSPGSGRGIVWVLDAATGRVIRKIDTGAGGSTVQQGCNASPCPAGLTHIKGFSDAGDRNNLVTRVYGGDLLGNVWRIDLSQLTSTGGSAQVTKLTTLTAPNGSRQPVTSAPELGKVKGIAVVYIGTGSYLGLSDLGSSGVQSFYAIKDPLTTVGEQSAVHTPPRSQTCGAATDRNCFVKQIYKDANGERTATSTLQNSAVEFRTMNGWYVDLPQTGERLITEPELQLGILAFVTSVPGSAEACKIGGSSYLHFVDYASGLTLKGESSIGYPISSGLGSGVMIVGTSDGKLVIMPGGGAGPDRIPPTEGGDDPSGTKPPNKKVDPPEGQGTRRISWRELITDR